MLILRNSGDIEKFVLGATVLGTGGGGNPREGLGYLKECLRLRGYIEIRDISELPRKGYIVVPYFVGSIAPTAKTKKRIVFEKPIEHAFSIMREVIDEEIVAVAPTEIGGGNTAIAIYIGCSLGIPTVDGDLLGRAAPELHQSTANIFGVPMYPSVIVTSTGNVVIVKRFSDIDDYESIARYLSILDGRSAAVVDTPMPIDVAEKILVRGSLSLCYRIGEAIIESRNRGYDPVRGVAKVLDGWIIFRGIVSRYTWSNEGGFLIGEAEVKGIDMWEGKTLKSWIKNEHIFLWIDNKPIVMPPDIASFLLCDGTPITNSDLSEGMKVNVIAARAPSVWRTARGLELFGPRRFGLNYEYIPVEELVKGFPVENLGD